MKKGLIFIAMLAGVLICGYSQTDYRVHNTSSWIEAINGIRSGENDHAYTITVTGNISVPASQANTFGPATGITVTITGGGTLSTSSNGILLVIGNDQTIIARDLTLKGHNANDVPVVLIVIEGTFRMEGKASVSGNKSKGNRGGGGVFVAGGTFAMQDRASVSGNTAYEGGGVYIADGTFTMQDSASVSGNVASGGDWKSCGGGVYVAGGTFTMQGGTISGNSTSDGGGVYVNGGTFTMQGGAISSNTAYDGGGVFVSDGTFTMHDGIISGNTASRGGGGVNFDGGIFTMQGGSIAGNKAADYGGGVYGSSGMMGRTGKFFMKDGTIAGNTASEGGGVYNKGAFTLEDGTISSNTSSIKGGGVYTDGGSFTMQGGTISGNKAITSGGGVFVSERGGFIKTGGTFYGYDAEQSLRNSVVSRLGHAVYKDGEKNWRNASAGPAMNSDSYGFWMNDGDNLGDAVVTFPSDFAGRRQRSNFKNKLTVTENTMKSSSSNSLWILQSFSGDSYTLKRSDAANTMRLIIKLGKYSGSYFGGNSYSLVISGDSGSGENNWNGTWQ